MAKLAHKANQAYVTAYVKAATEVLPKFFRPDCCLNGTRVALEVFKRFGIPAEPIPCRMFVTNKIARDFIAAAGGRGDQDEATLLAWKAAGAWMIVIDGQVDDQGYGRHLVCLAAGMLVDSAFGQFHRPQYDIVVPPVMAGPIGSSFRASGEQYVESADGATALYMRDPSDRTYEQIAGFQRSAHNLEAVEEVLRVMRRS